MNMFWLLLVFPLSLTEARTYTKHAGMDAFGNDIGTSPFPDTNITKLKQACDNTAGCVAFNSIGWLKSATGGMSASIGIEYYTLDPTRKCVMWRQTGNCSPNGPRQPQFDKYCIDTIPEGWSGYCECENGRKANPSSCNHSPFTCAKACLKPPGPGEPCDAQKTSDSCHTNLTCTWCSSTVLPEACYTVVDASKLPSTFTCDPVTCDAYTITGAAGCDAAVATTGAACTWCQRSSSNASEMIGVGEGEGEGEGSCLNMTVARTLPKSVFRCDNVQIAPAPAASETNATAPATAPQSKVPEIVLHGN